MTRFAAMFVPTPASLAKGMTPASWMILTDGGDAALDQVIQRATRKASAHLGLTDTVHGGQVLDAAGNLRGVELYEHEVSDEPCGEVVWVEAPLDLLAA